MSLLPFSEIILLQSDSSTRFPLRIEYEPETAFLTKYPLEFHTHICLLTSFSPECRANTLSKYVQNGTHTYKDN